MAQGALRFGMLGPLQASANGADLPLGAAKQRAVLAILLINRNRIVPIYLLIDAVWQEQPPPEVRGSLHAHISRPPPTGQRRRRRRCHHCGQRPAGVSAQRARRGLRHRPRSRSNKKRALERRPAADSKRPAAHLSAALSEWRGPVLEDLRDFPFVDAFAAALTEDKLAALTARAEAEIAWGGTHSIISELEAPGGRSPLPRTAVGTADNRLLPCGTPIRCTRGVRAAEDHARRRSRH